MKNEDRVVEILAELLRKQDQHDEKLNRIISIQERQGETLDKHTELFTLFISEIKGLRSDFNRMTDFLQTKQDKLEDRVKRLEDSVFRSE
jgi:hypothetical protein